MEVSEELLFLLLPIFLYLINRLTTGESLSDREQTAEQRERLIDGKRLEIYADHLTREMHGCFLCDEVSYRSRPVKQVGKRWICIDCIRRLREVLDTLQQWEEEARLGQQMDEELKKNLGLK